MSVFIQGDQVRAITQGILVKRATEAPADEDLFSIDGGRIIIVGFLGEVTGVIDAGSIDIALNFDPDDGGTDVVISTDLVIDADEVGTMYTLNTTFGSAMVATLDYAANAILATPLVFGAGDIKLNLTGTASTDSIKWDLIYVPLDTGASVTAV